MERQLERVDRVPVVHITGRFDRTRMFVSDMDVDTLVESGSTHVVIDLSQVSFLDAYGLALLGKWAKHCRQHGCDVLVTGIPPRMCSIFELTRLNHVFTMYPDIDTALATAT